MSQLKCRLVLDGLSKTKRVNKNEICIQKNSSSLDITFSTGDTYEKFEQGLNDISGSSSFLSYSKKKFSAFLISFVSVLIIMIGLLGASIYEDLLKKVLFELPFSWNVNDTISLLFVCLFFFVLMLVPSFLDPEGSDFKNILSSWFNKDIKKLKKLKLALGYFDRKLEINLYNFDIVNENHWLWKLLVKSILSRFYSVNFYIRSDQIDIIKKNLHIYNILNIKIDKVIQSDYKINTNILLSDRELKLYSMMQLSSSSIIASKESKKIYVSFELFEYCDKNFSIKNNNKDNESLCSFHTFVDRSFNDFHYLVQKESMKIHFTKNVNLFQRKDDQLKLSYYLRNHIEECLEYFSYPMSFLILYYYVKDIVLDKRRTINILEKFIEAIYSQQEYEMIDSYWFEIAGKMFNSNDINSFSNMNNSFYRQLSIESLMRLGFLFERTGHYTQSLLIHKYLYEINPNKFALRISAIYERMGKFDKAYSSLPLNLDIGKKSKPNEIELNYFKSKSWIIVSQRKQELKEEGLIALKNFKELLFSHNEENDALWLWYYYNILANYNEWNGDYEEAILNYKKCLAIPTLGAFEYGATFVNMSIAHRLIYLSGAQKNFKIIEESISLGKIGMELKESVGDRDEMPVVLHNQALNILIKILYTEVVEKECHTIILITSNAIRILDKTDSIKKLGILLCENIISKSLLNIDYTFELRRLKSQINLIDEDELSQIVGLYSKFIKYEKIVSIHLLDKYII